MRRWACGQPVRCTGALAGAPFLLRARMEAGPVVRGWRRHVRDDGPAPAPVRARRRFGGVVGFADCPAVLARTGRGRTRFVHCVHCAQTAAASQITKRACPSAGPQPVRAALLGTPQARRHALTGTRACNGGDRPPPTAPFPLPARRPCLSGMWRRGASAFGYVAAKRCARCTADASTRRRRAQGAQATSGSARRAGWAGGRPAEGQACFVN